ncbi:MAG: protein-glutamate O-methyltransferase CheR [Euryarchaeota archaeon]|nr:protein-glutamate O-methyltransferase CheR [Euryarchaeota archaeon]
MASDLAPLREKLLRERGFDISHYREPYVQRRLGMRLAAMGCRGVGEYLGVLDRDPGEYRCLLDALAINVTHFFRNPETFRALEGGPIVEMLERKRARDSRLVRIWSAGCASGEEAYTLSIMMREVLRDRPGPPPQVSILGTDLDEGALAQARAGEYKEPQVKEMDPVRRARYLVYDGSRGIYRVGDVARQGVRFQRADLHLGPPYTHWDLILCRNVIIYFPKDSQEHLFRGFHGALVPGGYLVIGKSESPPPGARDIFEVVDAEERIYRRAP